MLVVLHVASNCAGESLANFWKPATGALFLCHLAGLISPRILNQHQRYLACLLSNNMAIE